MTALENTTSRKIEAIERDDAEIGKALSAINNLIAECEFEGVIREQTQFARMGIDFLVNMGQPWPRTDEEIDAALAEPLGPADSYTPEESETRVANVLLKSDAAAYHKMCDRIWDVIGARAKDGDRTCDQILTDQRNDLLDACKSFARIYPSHAERVSPDCGCAVCKCSAAIVKAEGK